GGYQFDNSADWVGTPANITGHPLAVGEFDGDTKLDFVQVGYNPNVGLLGGVEQNNGSAAFTLIGTNFGVPTPVSVAPGAFYGTTATDLAVLNDPYAAYTAG